MNIFQALVEHFGTQKKAALALGVEQGTVSGWVRQKHGMSPIAALRAEEVTGGKFSAVALWPDLARLDRKPARDGGTACSDRRAQLAPDDHRGRRTTDPTGAEIETLRDCAEQAFSVAERLAG
jgi:DNA-binding transcriptional regulator YdaS (Cro superfamily)